MSRQIYEHDFVQATDLFDSIETDRKNLSEEQVEEIKEVVVVAHGIKGGCEQFVYNGGFEKGFILDFQAYIRIMREESLPPLAAIQDERVRELCTLAEKIFSVPTEKILDAVDRKFITEPKGKKKKSS